MNVITKEYQRLIVKKFKELFLKFSSNPQNMPSILKDFIEFLKQKLANQHTCETPDIPLIKGFSEKWTEYFLENYSRIDILKRKLYDSLDKLSIEYAELFLERNVYNFQWKYRKDNPLQKPDLLYSSFEKQELSEVKKNKPNIPFLFPDNTYPENFVFVYDSGLAFVNDIVADYIKGKDFIDGGAFIGDSALSFIKYQPERIFSFEPNKENYNLLSQTININRLGEKIKAVPKGLGERSERISFSGEGLSYSAANIKNTKTEEVEVITIDDFVIHNNIIPGLIKLDIEGLEYECIKGALNVIKDKKPVLLISIYHNMRDFFEIKPLLEDLKIYNFMIRKTNPYYLNTELMLIAYPSFLQDNF